jgi:hypothetical protein
MYSVLLNLGLSGPRWFYYSQKNRLILTVPLLVYSESLASGAWQPLVGKLGDKGSSRVAVGWLVVYVDSQFYGFLFSGTSVIGIIFGIIFIDIGCKESISNQTCVYSIMPEARNRMNMYLCL